MKVRVFLTGCALWLWVDSAEAQLVANGSFDQYYRSYETRILNCPPDYVLPKKDTFLIFYPDSNFPIDKEYNKLVNVALYLGCEQKIDTIYNLIHVYGVYGNQVVADDSGATFLYNDSGDKCYSPPGCIQFLPLELCWGSTFSFNSVEMSLLKPLIGGKHYILNLKIKRKLPDFIMGVEAKNLEILPPHPDFGVSFSNRLARQYFWADTSIQEIVHHHPFPKEALFSDSWFSVSIPFFAQGGEQTLSLGIFPRDVAVRKGRMAMGRKADATDVSFLQLLASKYHTAKNERTKQKMIAELRYYFPFWDDMPDSVLVSVPSKIGQSFNPVNQVSDPWYYIDNLEILPQ